MSRTDDLRRGGATERGGGGGGTPFVKWPDTYAWVEGTVADVWEGKYGSNATLAVTATSDGLEAAGTTEDGDRYQRAILSGAEVNVGLNYATLKDTITAADKGRHFHVAFEGWGETKSHDRYRIFAVLEVPLQEERAQGNAMDEYDAPKAAAASDDDPLPF